jgi:hypothetical protein
VQSRALILLLQHSDAANQSPDQLMVLGSRNDFVRQSQPIDLRRLPCLVPCQVVFSSFSLEKTGGHSSHHEIKGKNCFRYLYGCIVCGDMKPVEECSRHMIES